jgi:hypothetical protein
MRQPGASLSWSGALAMLFALPAFASTHFFEFSNLDLAVPDGSSSGASATRSLTLPAAPIAHVRVWLDVQGRDGSPAYNGDLYAALTHGNGYSVLLNRVGRRAGSVVGYGDNGFSVIFDDTAANGDVHAYRLELNGSHTARLPASEPLTGVWAPDGRRVSPAQALLSDPQTALLDQFAGMDANGAWTLLVADWETGGLAKVDRWALEITLVPEPVASGVLVGLALAGWAFLRCRPGGRSSRRPA